MLRRFDQRPPQSRCAVLGQPVSEGGGEAEGGARQPEQADDHVAARVDAAEEVADARAVPKHAAGKCERVRLTSRVKPGGDCVAVRVDKLGDHLKDGCACETS